MFKFKIPNTGLKQYRNLSEERFFQEVYKRNKSEISAATGGHMSEERWVRMLQTVANATGMTPKEVIQAESEKLKYNTKEDFDKLQAEKALKGTVTEDGQSAFDWIRKNVRGKHNRFISPTSGEWLEDGTYQVGDIRIEFNSKGPYSDKIKSYNDETGEWETLEEFSKREDREITRKQGRFGR